VSIHLSSGVLHAYRLACLRGEGFWMIRILRLQLSHLLLPGQLDVELSPIIVLATVVSLYIPFALSSDRLIFT
jgi:hypothetical protein